jgi:hypothetical protein
MHTLDSSVGEQQRTKEYERFSNRNPCDLLLKGQTKETTQKKENPETSTNQGILGSRRSGQL